MELNLQDEIQNTILPTRTYKVENGRILGWTSGLEAMQQMVQKLLSTERFENVIYSEDYGVELNRLIGESYDFVKSDLERTITAALLVDDRIEGLEDFIIKKVSGESLLCTFTVRTIDGSIGVEKEVSL
ncbi:DUF2634 domain-containing protein [Bacillaceae bacterium Marseille-Q3522]|nr:DUF2634 domain-containing protein [Bacillaceae bacterium Marseille-Q3522]